MKECIETTRTPSQKYGSVSIKGKLILEHRLVYEQNKGPIPAGMVVRHMCHNSRCINPDHLEIGTQGNNLKDMIDAGRSLKGTKNPANKLTNAQAKRIKYGKEKRSVLAKEFGVTAYTIDKIRKGINWTWI